MSAERIRHSLLVWSPTFRFDYAGEQTKMLKAFAREVATFIGKFVAVSFGWAIRVNYGPGPAMNLALQLTLQK
jgi:hypothetical protein